MNSIIRRVSKLECRFTPRLDEYGSNIGEALRERARRYDAEHGREPEPAHPPQSASCHRPRTIGEMLRLRRFSRPQDSEIPKADDKRRAP
jgi:hypothetical protein